MAEYVPDDTSGTPRESNPHKRLAHELPNIYNMNHQNRGFAVIINNKTFSDLPERTGTDVDRNAMKSLLMSMGFQENHIIIKDNCCTRVMQETMREVAEQSYKNRDCDCFVGVVLSHGISGEIVGENADDIMTVNDLTKPFKATECPSLAGKPKIFFFQMCRGLEEDKGADVEESTEHNAEEDECIYFDLPSEADFLFAFSTVPGYVSWRNEKAGSIFIQSIVEVFRRHEQWRRQDLVSMQTEVNKTVAINYGDKLIKQMPCFTSMLTRKVTFSDRQQE